MVGVEQWAEVRRMARVEGLSARGISRRTGLARATVARLLAAPEPPRYARQAVGSKLDPFKDWICEQLRADPRIHPRFVKPRTFQRTIYRPGELVQCDLWEPRELIPVGHGQERRGWVVTCEVCWSRAIVGALIFSKEAPDILFGLARNLSRLGALPEKLVWDRESAIAAGGRPTAPFAAFCGQLSVGWVILEARDPEAKGALERSHRFMRSNFEPGRVFANHFDFQDRLDAWTEKANRRKHRTTRAIPIERLAEEQARMQALPARMPDTDRRQVVRVPAQPYVRVDRNDYSVDPAFVGRRVELRVSQTEVMAVVLDTGELAAKHRRVFAGGVTVTDPAHQTELERQREKRRRRRDDVEVEIRPLSRYDALIGAV